MASTLTRRDPLETHRGPFRFCLTRPNPEKPGHKVTQWLAGGTRGTGRELRDEARALLDDPRDTIEAISVYSETEQQFVTTFRRGGRELLDPEPIPADDEPTIAVEHIEPAPLANALQRIAPKPRKREAIDLSTIDLSDLVEPTPAAAVHGTASEPHIIGTEAPTPENDPAGRFTPPADTPAATPGRKTCPYGGTKLAEVDLGTKRECPVCGCTRSISRQRREAGQKPGDPIFPHHPRKEAK